MRPPFFPALGDAAMAPAPRAGEYRRTQVADSADGLKREMHRMVMAVRQGIGDPAVIDVARMVLRAYDTPAKNKLAEAAAEFDWAQGHWHYIADPIGREVLQTPGRMARQVRMPREVLARIMAPVYGRAQEGVVRMSSVEMKGLPGKAMGDCDEAATFMASLLGSVGILPRFRFGGDRDGLYHVWTQAWLPPSELYGVSGDGTWVDMDVTEPSYSLGEHAPFKVTAHMNIFEA